MFGPIYPRVTYNHYHGINDMVNQLSECEQLGSRSGAYYTKLFDESSGKSIESEEFKIAPVERLNTPFEMRLRK